MTKPNGAAVPWRGSSSPDDSSSIARASATGKRRSGPGASLLSELQGLMAEYKFMPRHGLGQNFITDVALLDRIVEEASLGKKDTVLEVGCGTGFLTERLLSRSKVVGFEKDPKMAEILRKRFGARKNFSLRNEDFTSAKLPEFNKLVSLPPYGISTDLIVSIFMHEPEKAVLVLQREFIEKVIAEPGFWDYSYVSVLSSLRFKPKVAVHSISPKAFYPLPQSFSALIVFERKGMRQKIKSPEKFVLFLKNVFRYRNKNFSNALQSALPDIAAKTGIKKSVAEKALAAEGRASEKVNQLEPEFFADFFTRISR